MSQALYRKYRSKSFNDVVGQEHITKLLSNSLKKGNIAHAYLLSGPRGVGKTSVARILAHEVNGLKYDDEQLPIDIIEIDAASNRRIDEVRDIREKIQIAPVSSKYKIYIIDEVHMLTREAFNALLKTLEEPPGHALLVLATTEPHKLPETIVSRCLHFRFKPVNKSNLVNQLKYIANQEGIEITDDVLHLLAEHGQGSFRDAIGALDQARAAEDKLTSESIYNLLGLIPDSLVGQILSAVKNTDISACLDAIESSQDHGANPVSISKQLQNAIRQDFLNGEYVINRQVTLMLLKNLLTVNESHDPSRALEIYLLEAILSSPETKTPQTISTRKHEIQANRAPKKPATKPVDNGASQPKSSGDIWPQALESIKTSNSRLHSIARMAEVKASKNSIDLHFKFPFHAKRIKEPENIQLIKGVLKNLTGKEYTVNVILMEGTNKQQSDKGATQPDNKETISNIFGQVEMLD